MAPSGAIFLSHQITNMLEDHSFHDNPKFLALMRNERAGKYKKIANRTYYGRPYRHKRYRSDEYSYKDNFDPTDKKSIQHHINATKYVLRKHLFVIVLLTVTTLIGGLIFWLVHRKTINEYRVNLKDWPQAIKQNPDTKAIQKTIRSQNDPVNFVDNSPLPVPLTPDILKLATPRIQQLSRCAQKSVGLENLAFAFSDKDALSQGEFLGELVSTVNGFILLDLHNLYCQMVNFQLDPMTLLQSYPPNLVRELHVSGGSWSKINNHLIRRDTHDQPMIDDVFVLLKMALALFPNVEVVIYERLLGTLTDTQAQQQFIKDYFQLKEVCYDLQ